MNRPPQVAAHETKLQVLRWDLDYRRLERDQIERRIASLLREIAAERALERKGKANG